MTHPLTADEVFLYVDPFRTLARRSHAVAVALAADEEAGRDVTAEVTAACDDLASALSDVRWAVSLVSPSWCAAEEHTLTAALLACEVQAGISLIRVRAQAARLGLIPGFGNEEGVGQWEA